LNICASTRISFIQIRPIAVLYLLSEDLTTDNGLEYSMRESFSNLVVQRQYREMLWSISFHPTIQCDINCSFVLLFGERVQLGHSRQTAKYCPLSKSIHLPLFSFYSIIKYYNQMLLQRKSVHGRLLGQFCYNV
jgi:hypothetical protein